MEVKKLLSIVELFDTDETIALTQRMIQIPSIEPPGNEADMSEFVKKYRAVVLNFVQMLTAFLLSSISLFLFGETKFQVSAKGWLSVLYLGVISTTVCYLLQTASQKYVDETKAAIILSMESVFGTMFSILILHERVTLRMVCGCVIILAAVIISNLADAQAEPETE